MGNGARFLIALLSLVVAALARADGVGMVLDVIGPAKVDIAGRSLELDIAGALTSGMRISLDKGSELSFVFYPTRQQFTAKGPATLLLLERSIKQLQGNPMLSKVLPENHSNVTLAFQNRVVLAAVVMRGGSKAANKARLDEPIDGETVLTGQPVFTWTTVTDDPVDFFLTYDGTLVHQQRVKGKRLVLPGTVQLDNGGEYQWHIAPVSSTQGGTSLWTFTVASASLRAQIEQSKPPEGSALADWLLYAMTLDEANMKTEANRILKYAAEQRPMSKNLPSLTR